jgi:methionyl-tRNA formyltransferase
VTLPRFVGRPHRLAYLGTPEVAVAPLRALAAAGFEIVAAVTNADKRRGRGNDLVPSAVKQTAGELGIPVVHQVDALLDLEPAPQLGVVVAFGRLIRPHVLERIPMVNLHFSLLPRWRGAAPVERALLAGDSVTGVCVMEVAEGLDTGDVYAREEIVIEPDDTLSSLRTRLVELGTSMLLEQLHTGLGEPVPQVGEAVYASKIDPAELQIDWTRTAAEIDRLVRLGGAWTTLDGRRLKVVDARPASGSADPGVLVDGVVGTGSGALQLVTVQPEGKAAMPWSAFANGARLTGRLAVLGEA